MKQAECKENSKETKIGVQKNFSGMVKKIQPTLDTCGGVTKEKQKVFVGKMHPTKYNDDSKKKKIGWISNKHQTFMSNEIRDEK